MVHPALVSQQVIIPQDGINVNALDPMAIIIIIIIMVMFTITLVITCMARVNKWSRDCSPGSPHLVPSPSC